MDRGEFAASLSDEQREFIEGMRDDAVKAGKSHMNGYKEVQYEFYFGALERNIAAAQAYHFLLNEIMPDSFKETYDEYEEIARKRWGGTSAKKKQTR